MASSRHRHHPPYNSLERTQNMASSHQGPACSHASHIHNRTLKCRHELKTRSWTFPRGLRSLCHSGQSISQLIQLHLLGDTKCHPADTRHTVCHCSHSVGSTRHEGSLTSLIRKVTEFFLADQSTPGSWRGPPVAAKPREEKEATVASPAGQSKCFRQNGSVVCTTQLSKV